MNKECEGVFIELISPYLTALEIAKACTAGDWHRVFVSAEALKQEVTELQHRDSRIPEILSLAEKISDLAIGQESRIMHYAEPKAGITIEEAEINAEVQEKLRELIIDKICACETGSEIVHKYEEGKFPQQDKSLATIKALGSGFRIVEVHDDGDLTVESDGRKYVVTTDGAMFGQEKT